MGWGGICLTVFHGRRDLFSHRRCPRRSGRSFFLGFAAGQLPASFPSKFFGFPFLTLLSNHAILIFMAWLCKAYGFLQRTGAFGRIIFSSSAACIGWRIIKHFLFPANRSVLLMPDLFYDHIHTASADNNVPCSMRFQVERLSYRKTFLQCAL